MVTVAPPVITHTGTPKAGYDPSMPLQSAPFSVAAGSTVFVVVHWFTAGTTQNLGFPSVVGGGVPWGIYCKQDASTTGNTNPSGVCVLSAFFPNGATSINPNLVFPNANLAGALYNIIVASGCASSVQGGNFAGAAGHSASPSVSFKSAYANSKVMVSYSDEVGDGGLTAVSGATLVYADSIPDAATYVLTAPTTSAGQSITVSGTAPANTGNQILVWEIPAVQPAAAGSVFTNDGRAVKVEIAFSATRGTATVSGDANDTTSAPNWVDVSRYVLDIKAQRGKQYELDQAQAGNYSLTLNNIDGRFDPNNTSSPYAPYVLGFRRLRISSYTSAGTQTFIFNGWLQDFPQTWSQMGNRGSVVVSAIDPLTLLGQVYLGPAFQSTVLLDSPTNYWPMQEASGSTSAGNFVAAGQPLTQRMIPAAGTDTGTTGSYDFGTSMPDLVGAGVSAGSPATGLAIVANHVTSSTVMTEGLYLKAPVSIPWNAPWYVSCMVTNGYTGPLFCLYDGPGRNYIGVDIISGGNQLQVSVNGTPSSVMFFSAPSTTSIVVMYNPNDSNPLKLSTDGGTTYNATSSAFPSWYVPTGGWAGLCVGVSNPRPTQTGNGVISNLSTYAGTYPDLPGHTAAAFNAFANEDTATRFRRIIGWVPWYGPVLAELGDSVVGPCNTISGQTGTQALLDIADDEVSNFFVHGNGAIVFERRSARPLAPVAATFGEHAGELHYEEDVQVGYDPTLVYNQVTGQRVNGAITAVQDATSVLRYFPRTYPDNPLSLRVSTDQAAADTTNFLLGRYKQPVPRVTNVTFDLVGNPSQIDAVLGLEVGSRVLFNRRPMGASVITFYAYVENISHQITPTDKGTVWTCTLQLSGAFDVVAVTDLRVTLQASAAAGATQLVINPLPDAAVNPVYSSIAAGSPQGAVGPAFGDTPVDYINPPPPVPGTTLQLPSGGVVTVTAVTQTPPTGPGYTSATLTVTPALGAARAAGTVLDESIAIGGYLDGRAAINSTIPVGL